MKRERERVDRERERERNYGSIRPKEVKETRKETNDIKTTNRW